MSQTVARLLNSFSAGGQRFHTTKAMSDVHTHIEQYAGDNALYCMNGMHSYTNGICAWCDRRDHHWLSDHAPSEAAPH